MKSAKPMRYHGTMEDWRGFLKARDISQIYETTISDSKSNLSAHFITVPARSLGGDSYLLQELGGSLDALGLLRLADVPLGMTARSLAACLVSENVDDFLQRFAKGFEEEIAHPSAELPAHFEFAEYLTFSRRIPFEEDVLSSDSLGNILTGQRHGTAGYMYHQGTDTPMLAVAIPAGMLICGSAPHVIRALEAGLRQRLLELVKSRSSE